MTFSVSIISIKAVVCDPTSSEPHPAPPVGLIKTPPDNEEVQAIRVNTFSFLFIFLLRIKTFVTLIK